MPLHSPDPATPAIDTTQWKRLHEILRRLMLWSAIVLPLSAIVGSLCAVFLWLLDRVTQWRFDHPAILWALPVAGVAVGLAYHVFGKSVEGGNNMILDQIHEPGAGIPMRMAPLVLMGTVVSHLFGASVGREGTAVQIGASIGSGLARLFGLDARGLRVVLMAGAGSGFASVFGTPVAGAIFGMEVLTIGRIEYEALIPVAASSILADWVCHWWGIEHTSYKVTFAGFPDRAGVVFHADPLLVLKVGLAACCFGLASRVFAESVPRLAPIVARICPSPWLRPALGGVLTIALVYIAGTRDYLGLGIVAPEAGGASILNFFHAGDYTWCWAWKILFTVCALATGYKGGEVTPLFFIGAALGHTLSGFLNVPVDLLAGIGFISVFAGAANTPLACTFMGVELFGASDIVYIATGCFVAYLCSGHTGIYLSQRIGVPKDSAVGLPEGMILRKARRFRAVPKKETIATDNPN